MIKSISEKEFEEAVNERYRGCYEYDTFYHYTSINALYEIINSKKIWLTSLSSANDPTELKLDYDKYIKVINKIAEEENNSPFIDFIKRISNTFVYPPRSQKQNFRYFGLSLTGESNSLIHWKTYADDFKGVAIGINGSIFEDYIYSLGLDPINQKFFGVQKMIYDSPYNLIKKEFENHYYITLCDEVKEYFALSPANANYVLELVFAIILPFIKRIEYKDEREYRLIWNYGVFEIEENYNNIDNNDNKKDDLILVLKELGLDKIVYKKIGNEIRSLVELNLSNVWNKFLFPKIVLGKNCEQDVDELQGFLESNGLYNVIVERSEFPVR